MDNFKVHFCQKDQILREYTAKVINNTVKDSSCYSSLISTQQGLLTMQKLFRDYLYNTFELYQPYPNWRSMTVHLSNSIQDFSDNNILDMNYFNVDDKYFLYGFKVSLYDDSVALYVLAL